MSRFIVSEIQQILLAIAKETKLDITLDAFGSDRIVITVTEHLKLVPGEQPAKCNFNYLVCIDLDDVDSTDYSKKIKIGILKARQNILGVIDDNYDPDFYPEAPTSEELMASMGHNKPVDTNEKGANNAKV